MEELVVKVDGREYKVFVEQTDEGKVIVHCEGESYEVETKKDAGQTALERIQKRNQDSTNKNQIVSQLPGVIFDIKVKEGQKVKEGESILTLMAMKMENDVSAPKDCIIKKIKVKKNDNVNKGDVLAEIE
jgi:glutaconyl-CoA/methylmalonyl-CoA decarboxylase subunit gamma